MVMPLDLVLVRHGQSEQNLASHLARKGDHSLYTDEFRARHVSRHRLTPLGCTQAQLTGEWLRAEGLARFDRRISSDYIRAKETAFNLGVHGPRWYTDPLLREREWGELDGLSWEQRLEREKEVLSHRTSDSFYWIPPNGESIAQMTVRLGKLFNTLHRECSKMRVIIVCHGEVMWALRFMIEQMTISRWMQLEASKAPGVKIFNCQVLHYTRRDPSSGLVSEHVEWMRSVCPASPDNNGPGWERIQRERQTDEQLREEVERVPHLFRLA